MQRSKFFLYLLVISLSSAPLTAFGTQQVGPRKYLIKPFNLGISTDVRARSTRNLQVRVTDENDRPIPDAQVLFLLSSGGTDSSSVGSFAGQTSLRAMTNAEGVAQVDYTAGETVGSKARIKAQVEGSDAVWEATLLIISALTGDSSPQSSPQAAPQALLQSSPQSSPQSPPQSPQAFTQAPPQASTQAAPQAASQKEIPFVSGLAIGQMPKSSVAHKIFTTISGEKLGLDSRRGKIIVVVFFGTWCPISKQQFQALPNILDKDRLEEIQVVGMSVKDPRATPQTLLQFMTEQKVTYPIVQDVEDKHFVKFVGNQNVSVPQTVIYGRDGRIIAHFLGFNQQVGAEIGQKIKDELVKK